MSKTGLLAALSLLAAVAASAQIAGLDRLAGRAPAPVDEAARKSALALRDAVVARGGCFDPSLYPVCAVKLDGSIHVSVFFEDYSTARPREIQLIRDEVIRGRTERRFLTFDPATGGVRSAARYLIEPFDDKGKLRADEILEELERACALAGCRKSS